MVWLQISYNESAIRDRAGLLFFTSTFWSFVSWFNALYACTLSLFLSIYSSSSFFFVSFFSFSFSRSSLYCLFVSLSLFLFSISLFHSFPFTFSYDLFLFRSLFLFLVSFFSLSLYISFNFPTPMYFLLSLVPPEAAVLNKERAAGSYRLSAYFIGKTVSEVPLQMILPILFSCIVYWMAGLRPSAWRYTPLHSTPFPPPPSHTQSQQFTPHQSYRFFLFVVLIILTAQMGTSLGLVAGALVQNTQTAVVLSTIIILSTMLLGGFYVQNMRVWVRWARWVAFIRYCMYLSLSSLSPLNTTHRLTIV